jgi:hypothetical protein
MLREMLPTRQPEGDLQRRWFAYVDVVSARLQELTEEQGRPGPP